MVCITPSKKEGSDASKEKTPSLKEFKLSASEISKIFLPKVPTGEEQVQKGQHFCILQFNMHDAMGEFLRKYKD